MNKHSTADSPTSMPVSVRCITLGMLIALIGIITSSFPSLVNFENHFGLSGLFKLRGERAPPDEVIVVTVDPKPADPFALPRKADKRPREDHANLVHRLADHGAQVIVFDIFFDRPNDPRHDRLLVDALNDAGNVVLVEYLAFKDWTIAGTQARLEIRRPPFPALAQEAAALAPFPLPKTTTIVHQCWLFKAGAGDIPTLPAATLYVYARPHYHTLLALLRESIPSRSRQLPTQPPNTPEGISALSDTLHRLLQANPLLGQTLLERLSQRTTDDRTRTTLTALIGMHLRDYSHQLDFYGPPGTIPTFTYEQILAGDLPDLTGKAVFIGFSQMYASQQQKADEFHTPFIRADGVDLTGVEIAATAFGNLLEDRRIQWPNTLQWFVLITLWGILVAAVFLMLPPIWLLIAPFVLVTAYLALAWTLFGRAGIALPLVVPLAIQLPGAMLGALLWHYRGSRFQYQTLYELFGHFLPARFIPELLRESRTVSTHGRATQGVCIATDIERYTTLSETLQPTELRSLLNEYYQMLFRSIDDRGGFVSDVAGDTMIGIWENEFQHRETRRRACQAALEIAAAVDAFNHDLVKTRGISLPTRIGINNGSMVIGNVGGSGHYGFRAVGDTINTAARIQALNKQLGTRLLVSASVICDLDEFAVRALGTFHLTGKKQPTTLYELIGNIEEMDTSQRQCYRLFALGLQAFRKKQWERASVLFTAALKEYDHDGPSRYYLELCQEHLENLADTA